MRCTKQSGPGSLMNRASTGPQKQNKPCAALLAARGGVLQAGQRDRTLVITTYTSASARDGCVSRTLQSGHFLEFEKACVCRGAVQGEGQQEGPPVVQAAPGRQPCGRGGPPPQRWRPAHSGTLCPQVFLSVTHARRFHVYKHVHTWPV